MTTPAFPLNFPCRIDEDSRKIHCDSCDQLPEALAEIQRMKNIKSYLPLQDINGRVIGRVMLTDQIRLEVGRLRLIMSPVQNNERGVIGYTIMPEVAFARRL